MQKNIQSIRGMRDIHSQEATYWMYLEDTLRELSSRYGYEYIKFPILEKTGLFKRSIGADTDIVEKEMYTFEDRNGDSLSMRPEGTAVCVRAGLQHGLLYNQRRKFWYLGPMFRYERPQKDRYRQFEQFGLEVFGINSVDIEVELILFCSRLWEKLGIHNVVQLNINTIGTTSSRNKYRDELVTFFNDHRELLDQDSLRRLEVNPLRILDSKNPDLQQLISQAPNILDSLDDESQEHFKELQQMLDNLNIVYHVKPTLVRGLDYYNDTVFEWSTTNLGAKNEICAGGRYDKLVSLLGGHDCQGVGFAMGLDRIVSLMQQTGNSYARDSELFVISDDEVSIRTRAISMAENIRSKYPRLSIVVYSGSGNFKKQFKEASKSQSKVAVILGTKEYENNSVSVKILNDDIPQTMYTMQEFDRFLQNNLC